MVQRSFGHSLRLSLSPAHSWFSLGPGWAALAGAVSTGSVELDWAGLLKLAGLWLLADPLLGALWELAAPLGLWRNAGGVYLPPAPARGFYLPYTQPGSAAGRLLKRWRSYRLWWAGHYWPENGDKLVAYGVAFALALLIALSLNAALFWLTLLAIALALLAGQSAPRLASPEGGRLQSVVQWLLPWFMGVFLWAGPSPAGLALAVSYWAIYLGGLRMLGRHRRAKLLYFWGQAAVCVVLLALRLLPGAALIGVFLAAQQVLAARFTLPETFLAKAQPYLLLGLAAAALSLGGWPGR
jgi:hypothetical protein